MTETPEVTAAIGAGRFPRSARIRDVREFRRAKEDGGRVAQGCLLLNWLVLKPGQGETRLGVITTRKIGGAVVRNRARRLIREAFRTYRGCIAVPSLLVVVARNSIAECGQARVTSDLVAALRRARLARPAVEGKPLGGGGGASGSGRSGANSEVRPDGRRGGAAGGGSGGEP